MQARACRCGGGRPADTKSSATAFKQSSLHQCCCTNVLQLVPLSHSHSHSHSSDAHGTNSATQGRLLQVVGDKLLPNTDVQQNTLGI